MPLRVVPLALTDYKSQLINNNFNAFHTNTSCHVFGMVHSTCLVNCPDSYHQCMYIPGTN